MNMNGWLSLYKPIGVSSFSMIRQARSVFGNRTKVGYAGTLDPLAEGVLPLALGEATKTLPYLMQSPKEYIFEVTWGAERSTDDSEGEILFESPRRPTHQEIEMLLPNFLGQQLQLPPLYSAKKIKGRRACDLARSGQKEVSLGPSRISISILKLLGHHLHRSKFLIKCSTGTYVRSLARDFGRQLGCYGHAASILRTQVGPFKVTEAIFPEKLAEMQKKGIVSKVIKPLQAVLADIPAVLVTLEQTERLRKGQAVVYPVPTDSFTTPTACLCLDQANNPVALSEICGSLLKPKRVFNIE